MKLIKSIAVFLTMIIFAVGLAVFAYPYWHGYLVDHRIERNAEAFLSWVEVEHAHTSPTESYVVEDKTSEPTEPEKHTQLWRDMMAYNRQIYDNAQEDLDSKRAYEASAFQLRDYGLQDEIFGVISIPVLKLEMPVFLGTSSSNMAAGAAILGQTSIPIGGTNTNCVIAGHRGWGGASYFRYIDELKIGDQITITNLWETLHYEVAEIQIIWPYEVEQIHIQPERELVTLLSCHPYGSGGRQRYLVICERTKSENEPENPVQTTGKTINNTEVTK